MNLHTASLQKCIEPVLRRILHAPHRDISTIAFPELFRLYCDGLKWTTSHADMGSTPQLEASPTEAMRLRCSAFRAVFDEVCLRSALSTNWKDVEAPELPSTAHSPSWRADVLALCTTRRMVCTAPHPAGCSRSGSSGSGTEMDVVLAPPTVAMGSSAAQLATANAASRHHHHRQGVMLPWIARAIKAHEQHRDQVSGKSSSDSASVRFWVPFSTVVDVRASAFRGSEGSSGTSPSQFSNMSLSTLQLIRALVSRNAESSSGGSGEKVAVPIRVAIIPPSVEMEVVIRMMAGGRRGNGPSAAPPLAELCQDGLLRWAHGTSSLSRSGLRNFEPWKELLPPSDHQNSSNSSSSASTATSTTAADANFGRTDLGLCLEGCSEAQKQLVAKYVPQTSIVRFTLLEEILGREGPAGGAHRFVTQECSSWASKLASREASLRTMPRRV